MNARPVARLSVIVPAYNEERTLQEVVERVLAVKLVGLAIDVTIVDDASTDATFAIARRLEASHLGRVSVHRLPINVGKGGAVRLGMAHATGDVVLLQDADLELSPDDYPALLAPIQRGEADVVYGSRFMGNNRHVPLKTLIANRACVRFTNLLYGSELTDMATGFKVFRREVLQGMRLRSARFDIEPEITARLLRAGHRIVEVPVTYAPRTVAQGKTIGAIDGVEYLYTLLKYRWLG
jgi:glycosyltransferase involved in cell wall biosynthesis